MSMKNSKDIIGNRTRDLPACSALPQPTGVCYYWHIYFAMAGDGALMTYSL